MKTFTFTDIQIRDPNYDIGEYLPENWSGTALDILRLDTVPPGDRLWVVLRSEIIDDKTMRLFAVWCARSVQHLMSDPRSVAAIDVAEKFANGNATEAELVAARTEAWAAWETMRAGAGEETMRGMAEAAARSAVETVALSAQMAAWSASSGAVDTVMALWKRFRETQVAQLIKMLEAEA